MLIGSQYSDNKIYRGIRHYDSLPLSSEDIHEYSDTVYMKTAYIMNNIIGYGVLNAPKLSISTTGIILNEPVVVLINGDVSLINSDDNTPIITTDRISETGYTSGTLCIVGWYQSLNYSSTLRNYGGVENSTLENDLIFEPLDIQVSTRYQFRWSTVLVESNQLNSDSISFELEDRDEAGNSLGTISHISTTNRVDNVFLAPKSPIMNYAESDLYIIPILRYDYSIDSGSISSASAFLPITPKGSSGFIKSDTEPTGEYVEGTTWYNPTTREFKVYVEGIGFIDRASTMGFLQYQSIYEVTEDILDPQDIIVPVYISELQEGDILQVVYEGLVLVSGEQYNIDYKKNTISLLGFTVNKGDKVTFTVTKIVEANDITNITTTFTSHMASTASNTLEAHVKLSDKVDDSTSGVNSGVAATPKAVHDSRLITDSFSGARYKLGIENGILYFEEV